MKRKYVKDYIPDDTADGSYRYVGEYYYSHKLKEERVKSGKKQLLFGLGTLLFLFALLFIPSIGATTLYVVLPIEIMMICFVPYCIGSYALLSVEDMMERRFYEKAYENPIQILTVTLILEFFCILGQALGVLFYQGITLEDLFLQVGLIVHFIISFCCWNSQRKEMKTVVKH